MLCLQSKTQITIKKSNLNTKFPKMSFFIVTRQQHGWSRLDSSLHTTNKETIRIARSEYYNYLRYPPVSCIGRFASSLVDSGANGSRSGCAVALYSINVSLGGIYATDTVALTYCNGRSRLLARHTHLPTTLISLPITVIKHYYLSNCSFN